MTQVESDPVIVVLSDVHLGASKSQSLILYDFLMDIYKKRYRKNVKAIIIIGDFFDICMDNYSNIENDYKYIFDIFRSIKESIPIIFCLGNHEIQVSGNLDKNYKKHRDEFVRKFENPPFSEDDIGQYIYVRKNGKEMEIQLYDKLKAFDKRLPPINKFPIQVNLEQKGSFKCLLTHGHQLERKIVLFFVGGFIWGSLIELEDRDYKKSIDFLWNQLLSSHESVANLSKRDIKKLLKDETHTKKERKKFLKDLKDVREWEIRKDKNKNEKYFKKIRKFLKKKNRYKDLTHYVFGHSHKAEFDDKPIKKKPFILYNSGTWQKIKKPTFLEIDLKTLKISEGELVDSDQKNNIKRFDRKLEKLNRHIRRIVRTHHDNPKQIMGYSQDKLIEEAQKLDPNLLKIDPKKFEEMKKYNKIKQEFLEQPENKSWFIEENIDELKELIENISSI